MALNKALGQYFTVSETLQNFVYDKVKHKGAELLEPSFGAGHLLKPFLSQNPRYPMTCCELDTTVKPVVTFNPEDQKIIYGDFTTYTDTRKFKTIIGNPPYVKQRAAANLYIKFIELCFELLAPDGELIFIVPSDFIKLTSAAKIITKMTTQGHFTDFLFPHDERLFEGASVDVLIFRYEKGLSASRNQNKTIVNGLSKTMNVSNGIITFTDTDATGLPVSDFFNIYVGIVSGCDEIYKSPEHGNITVLTNQDKEEKFIYVESFPSENRQINEHLEANKETLMARKIRKFNEKNWFEWGAPRNIRTIQANLNSPCIYVKNMTRTKEVAFISTVQLFGGTLLCLIPKVEMTSEELEDTVKLFNSEAFQKDYKYAGRFKIGHKQISNAIIPI
jgi:adenine-specific DNA-methyltransferase